MNFPITVISSGRDQQLIEELIPSTTTPLLPRGLRSPLVRCAVGKLDGRVVETSSSGWRNHRLSGPDQYRDRGSVLAESRPEPPTGKFLETFRTSYLTAAPVPRPARFAVVEPTETSNAPHSRTAACLALALANAPANAQAGATPATPEDRDASTAGEPRGGSPNAHSR